jgi:hypothetical protein
MTIFMSQFISGLLAKSRKNVFATKKRRHPSVLVVEEAGVPGENHRPWASNWYTLSLATASRVHPFCNLQSRVRSVLLVGETAVPGENYRPAASH